MNARVIACAVVVGCAAVVCALSMEVRTGLDFFLPEGGSAQRSGQIIGALSRAPLARRVVLSIEAPDEPTAIAAWHAMAEALSGAPADLLSADVTEALGAELFAHREGFLSEDPEVEIPKLLAPGGVEQRIAALKRALGSGLGAVVRASAPRDPLMFFDRHVQRMAALDAGPLHRSEGALLVDAVDAAQPRHAILILAAHQSAFDGRAQAKLLTAIETAFVATNRAHGGRLKLELAAVARFSVAMERSIRRDVQRISIASTVGITLLFVLLLGSPRYLLLALLPLGGAFLTGTAACLLLHGRIHAMTFAFGAALIGVCIDYPIHLFNYHAQRGAEGSAGGGVRAALVMGSVTTAVGLSAMGLSGLPGIREVALFGIVGVLTALAITLWVLPPLLPGGAAPARHGRAAVVASDLFAWLVARRGLARAVVVAALAVAAGGISQLRFADDPRALTSVDPALEAEDQRVRQRAFGDHADERLAIVEGTSDREHALRRNDALAVALGEAREAGELGGFASLHSVLWSAELQQRNLDAVAGALRLAQVRSALETAGFVVDGFEPFFEEHAPGAARPSPLTPAALPAEVRRALIEPWFIDIDGAPAIVTRLFAVADGAALARRLARVDAEYVSIAAVRAGAYGNFRARTLQLAGLGLLAVLLVMALRYRKPWRTAAAFLPAALAAASTVGALALFGVELNLMHVVGLLLVLSMGADYGVFMVEHAVGDGNANAPQRSHTELSLIMACTSTVLSFGLLALSGIPALASVGQSVALGVVFSLLLAPAVLGAAGPGDGAHD